MMLFAAIFGIVFVVALLLVSRMEAYARALSVSAISEPWPYGENILVCAIVAAVLAGVITGIVTIIGEALSVLA